MNVLMMMSLMMNENVPKLKIRHPLRGLRPWKQYNFSHIKYYVNLLLY